MRSKPPKPLSAEAEALLQHERSIERVPPELAARVLARARAARHAGASPGFGASSFRRFWLFGATGVAASAIAFAALHSSSSDESRGPTPPHAAPEASEAPSFEAAAPAVEPNAGGAVVAPKRLPGTSDGTGAVGNPPAAAPRAVAKPVDSRADELAALQEARSAVGRGDYAGALRLLDAHRRTFPKSRLQEEGEALRIKALWGSGRREQARSALASFQRRFPESVLGAGLKATVQEGR